MLDYTKKEAYERSGLRINPAKTCQPVGAMYAALGVHACMPHSHGSQGCCAFHRMFLTRHFKDPAMGSLQFFYRRVLRLWRRVQSENRSQEHFSDL